MRPTDIPKIRHATWELIGLTTLATATLLFAALGLLTVGAGGHEAAVAFELLVGGGVYAWVFATSTVVLVPGKGGYWVTKNVVVEFRVPGEQYVQLWAGLGGHKEARRVITEEVQEAVKLRAEEETFLLLHPEWEGEGAPREEKRRAERQ